MKTKFEIVNSTNENYFKSRDSGDFGHGPIADVVFYLNEEHKCWGDSNIPIIERGYLINPGGVSVWGYCGSGPQDTSYDLLMWFGMPADEARFWACTFCYHFLNDLPKEGGTIKKEAVLNFIARARNCEIALWPECKEKDFGVHGEKYYGK